MAMWLGWESDCMSFLKSFSSSLLFILLAIFYTPMTEYIYICIYVFYYIYIAIYDTHVSILRNLMLYTLYIICTIYIYIIIYILHVLNVSFVSHTQENIRRALREVGQEPCYAAGGQARARKTPRRSVTTNRGSNMGFNHEQ